MAEEPGPPPPCLACGMPDPPPQPTCRGGMDHYVGVVSGCPHCGRTRVACALAPCTPDRGGL